MKVLVVGGGGREHALAWKCAQSPRVDRGAGRARQRRHGTRAEACATSTSPPTTSRASSALAAGRAASTSPSSAPRRRSSLGVVDAFEARRPALLRAARRRRAARGLQGLHEGVPAPPRHPDRRPTPRSPATTSTPTGCVAQRTPIVVKADGLAAGKGVVIVRQRRRGGRNAPRRCSRGSSAPPATQVVIEEFLRRRGSELHRDGRRRSRAAARDLAGPQAPRRRRRRPEHRRHGRLLARAGGHARDARAHHARGHRMPTVAALAADGMPYTRLPLRRHHDRRPTARRTCSSSTAGSAIRRRSRSCAGCARDLAVLCEAALDGAPRPGAHRLGPARGARRGDGRRRLSRRACARATDRRPRRRGQACRARCSTPAPRSPGGKVLVTSGGRVLCAVGLGDTVRAAQRRPTRSWTRFPWRTCSSGATSGIARSTASRRAERARGNRTPQPRQCGRTTCRPIRRLIRSKSWSACSSG